LASMVSTVGVKINPTGLYSYYEVWIL